MAGLCPKSRVLALHPVELAAIASGLDGVSEQLRSTGDVIASTISGLDWTGVAGDQARARGEEEQRAMRRAANKVEDAADATRQAGAALVDPVSKLKATAHDGDASATVHDSMPALAASVYTYSIDEQWKFHDTTPWATFYGRCRSDADRNSVTASKAKWENNLATLTTRARGLAMTVGDTDHDYATKLNVALADIAKLTPFTSVQTSGNGRKDGLIPPRVNLKDPIAVNKWWKGLDKSQQQRLLSADSSLFGNLNGIPAVDRSTANERSAHADVGRVEDVADMHQVSTDEVEKNPERYGLTHDDSVRSQNGRRTLEGLEHDKKVGNDPNRKRPTYIFAYDPLAFGGKGRAAIALGNPDTARNTSVIVPGTGSTVNGGWLTDGHNDARNLYQQANLADPNNPTAVIAWMGYETPDGFTDPGIATPGLAHAGAALLAPDVNGLWATHQGSSHITVLGHSYGSTTVADAAAINHMHANDVVLLGCPGTDAATSAADFHLDGGRVYVGDASTDPIGAIGESHGLAHDLNIRGLAGLGRDPAADHFGAIRFRAEVPGATGLNPHDHSHYYAMGSESLYNTADIASGHADMLKPHGMLAGERHQPHMAVSNPIPLPGGTNIPLPHKDVPIPGTPEVMDPEWDRNGVTDDHRH